MLREGAAKSLIQALYVSTVTADPASGVSHTSLTVEDNTHAR